MNATPKIGAFVLETLTTGMYTNPLDCVREYIQNASDAILSAKRFKQLKSNDGMITVTLDPGRRALTVRDNGTGVPSADAVGRLINVGMSSKVYGQEAGFRGIGRLAGIAYCKALRFRTSACHEDETTVVTFDCEGIRRSITPSMKGVEELADVLQKYTTQDIAETKKDEHFFEVTMEGLDERLAQFLDLAIMEEYLSQVTPVEYDAQRFLYATKIAEWATAKGLRIPSVKLLLRTSATEREVFKPYKTHYRTKQNNYEIRLRDISFFPEEPTPDSPFWLWYANHDYLGMFDDDRVAGLRFRRHNIAIGGPDRVAELFPGKEGRLNYWTIGEIHVQSDDIIPNARRDGFESTAEWIKLTEALQPFIAAHCKACRDASSSANRPTAKVVSSARATAETTKQAIKSGLTSHDERQQLIQKVEREAERVEAALTSRDTEAERQELQSTLTSLKAVRERLDEKDLFTVNKIKSSLDRKQRKLLIEVLGLINGALSDVSCFKSKQCLDAVKRAILSKYQVPED
jgi:molecular chaperone HtpG